jgi:hypothetical protein
MWVGSGYRPGGFDERPGQTLCFSSVGSGSGRLAKDATSQIPPNRPWRRSASGPYFEHTERSIDFVIRMSTAVAVLAVAGVAAYVSYWHAYAVVRAHGEGGITARLEPATIDGLVYASSMVVLYAARHGLPVPSLARWLLGLGIAADGEHGSGVVARAGRGGGGGVAGGQPGGIV